MRHLLSILSILLLSCTAIGDNHKEGTLYKWFTYSGVVWKGIGDKNIHHVYKGYVVNGVPNGFGILTSLNGSKYIGEFKGGNQTVKEKKLTLMEQFLLENIRMGFEMVKGY